jgi:hypothetical protein
MHAQPCMREQLCMQGWVFLHAFLPVLLFLDMRTLSDCSSW